MPKSAITEVPSERLDEVIEVLAEAFSDYEAMRYMLDSSDPNYSTRLRTLVGLFAKSRQVASCPILGVDIGKAAHLVAAALVDPPSQHPKSVLEDVTESLGPLVAERLRNFGAALAPLEPDFGVYYLGMIGVANGHRGKGYARLIINQIIETSVKDPESKGVLLTTKHEANLTFYKSMGFRTLGEATTEDGRLRSWTMFHADA